jgi:hypothetical protein
LVLLLQVYFGVLADMECVLLQQGLQLFWPAFLFYKSGVCCIVTMGEILEATYLIRVFSTLLCLMTLREEESFLCQFFCLLYFCLLCESEILMYWALNVLSDFSLLSLYFIFC